MTGMLRFTPMEPAPITAKLVPEPDMEFGGAMVTQRIGQKRQIEPPTMLGKYRVFNSQLSSNI